MVRGLIISLLLLVAYPLHAQILTGIMNVQAGATAGATPGFVSEASYNTTNNSGYGGSYQIKTNPSGQSDCPNYSLCMAKTELGLSNNLEIIPYTYAAASSVSTTATDEETNSFTCYDGSEDTSTTIRDGLCFASGTTAGDHRPYITFGTTTVSWGSGKVSEWYNVATSSALDAHNSCAGTTATTANCWGGTAITTTQANDLVYVHVCRVGTPATDRFTAGAGFTLITEDINDGCATEYEIASSAGAVTPTMTIATSSSSTYLMQVFAFKAASAGTAPTGWYMDKMLSWSMPSGSTATSEKMQFTTTGNLLLSLPSCGGQSVTALTSSNNTWTKLASATNATNGVFIGAIHAVGGAASDSTGLYTYTLTGASGDCTFRLESYQGAPSSPQFGYAPFGMAASSAAATVPIYCTSQSAISTCGGSSGTNYQPITDSNSWGSWYAAPMSGLYIGVGSQYANTTTGAPSGCLLDQGSYGGMSISGPGVWIDENNPWFHCHTSGPVSLLTMTQSQSTLAAQFFELDMIGIWGSPTKTAGIKAWGENAATSGSTVVVTLGNSVSTAAGDALLVPIQVYNGTARTISTVKCNDGSTTALTAVPSATSTGSGHGATAVYYSTSAPAGCTAVTVTASGSITDLEASFFDAVGVGGSAWTVDNSGNGVHTNNGTGTGGTCTVGGTACAVTTTAITTTGANDLCAAAVAVSGSGIIAAPQSGNEYVYGSIIFQVDFNGMAGLLTNSAASHQPEWTDGSASDSYSSSHACLAYN